MDRIKKVCKLHYLVSAVFLLITGALFCMAIGLHCQTDIYDYDHKKTIVWHTPYLYLAMLALAVCGIALVSIVLKRLFKSEEAYVTLSRVVYLLCGAVLLIAGAFWIFFYDSGPINDQRDIWLEARRIAGVVKEPFDTGYFAYYARNRGMALLMAGAIRMFGEHFYAFRLVNLAAALLLYVCLCKGAALLYRNPFVNALTAVLLLLFYPVIVYTAYLYGTMLSAAFVSLGICGTLLLRETGRLRYAFLLAIAFAVAMISHQSAAVGLLAAILYLFLSSGKENVRRNLLATVIAVLTLVLVMKAVDVTYEGITGADPDTSPVPLSCTIYMGLTSTGLNAGPGSQDGANARIYEENDRDGKAANRDAMQRIGVVLKEYALGERSLGFFLEKTQFQWLDPTFGARWTIRTNDPNMGYAPNSAAFNKFYGSSIRNLLFKLSIGLMLLIYFGAVVSGIKALREGGGVGPWVLAQLFVAGGFAFQMIWESFARYCFSYFLWLIPGAAYGIYLCGSFLADKIQKGSSAAVHKRFATVDKMRPCD